MCLKYTIAALRDAREALEAESDEYVRRQPGLSAGLDQPKDWGLSLWSPESELTENRSYELEGVAR